MEIVTGVKNAAYGGADSEHWKVVSGYQFGVRDLDVGGRADGRGHLIAAHHACEDCILVADVLIHRVREGIAAVIAAVMAADAFQENESLRIAYWQGLQDELVNQGEDGGVGADAEGERQNCYRGENRRFTKASEREFNVPDDVSHKCVNWRPWGRLHVLERYTCDRGLR